MGALAGLAIATTAGVAGAGTAVMTTPALQRADAARWQPGPGHGWRHERHGGGARWRRHHAPAPRDHGGPPWPHWRRHHHAHPHWSQPGWGGPPRGWVWDGWTWRPR